MDRDALAKMIWNKPFAEVTEAESEAAVQQYPYFAPARFVQLQKLDITSQLYQEQYQKAILYYHNPTTFGLFLNPPQDVIFNNYTPPTAQPEIVNEELSKIEEPSITEEVITTEPPTEQTDKTASKLDEPLVFEPFHTVDYFASQGIKPSVDDVPKDKFGKQLKSFTDWMKTMKKISPTEIAKDAGAEKNVEHMAAHSVEEARVITESMAEVWLKQGNSEKAIDTYRKLSLQNPAKSAYFAAKIERINSQK